MFFKPSQCNIIVLNATKFYLDYWFTRSFIGAQFVKVCKLLNFRLTNEQADNIIRHTIPMNK